MERDDIVFQHRLGLHGQVDQWGVCGEKRFPCRWGGAVSAAWGRVRQEDPLGDMEGKGWRFHHPCSWGPSEQPPLPWSLGSWGFQQGLPHSLEVLPQAALLGGGQGSLCGFKAWYLS